MTIELPVFRLGLGGFSPTQQHALRDVVHHTAGGATQWVVVAEFASADGWWLNGAQVELLGQEAVRIASGNPGEPPLQLYMPDIDRPVAFSQPISARQFRPQHTFQPASAASMNGVLEKFERWLAPLAAQFCLASQLVEQQAALGAGVFDLSLNGSLVAVVDMRGDVGVLPTLGPADFEQTVWTRRSSASVIPEHFARTSLSQLMWQYAVRTQRDVLPRHYRSGLLYFRRPPRLPQRLLRDSHLLLMRELAVSPGTFQTLQRRTGLDPITLAQDLAALYFVGTITSSPRRAAPQHRPGHTDARELCQGPYSDLPSMPDSVPPSLPGRQLGASDLTAPAPLRMG
jgi:hypothetical protein